VSFTHWVTTSTYPFSEEEGKALLQKVTDEALDFVATQKPNDSDKDELLDDFYFETEEEKTEALEALRLALQVLVKYEDEKIKVTYDSEEQGHGFAPYDFVCNGLCKALPEGAFGVRRDFYSDSREGYSSLTFFVTSTECIEAEDFFARYTTA
jgi:hypothetical protein